MRKAMIVQPMNGLADEEILEVKAKATERLNQLGFDVVNTFFEHGITALGVKNRLLYLLAKSLEKMSLCDAVYFCKGWENARGCKIEHEVAEAYGIEIIYQ
jgi:hypothetical protein